MILRPVSEELPPGTMIDGWKVVGPLGSGGFGVVHLVEKEGKRYALKLARFPEGAGDEKQTHERTRRELQCLLLLQHPGIVRVCAHGLWLREPRGYLYLVLEFIDGWTLAEWLERKHPTAHELLGVAEKIAAALAYMHGRGVFHRDLKLTNVMIRASDGEPVLIDFGAADFELAQELTGSGLPPGTERYRSPEAHRFVYLQREQPQARYEYKVADELFAFGVMLHDALTDPRPTAPRERTELNGLMARPKDPRLSNPRVPDAVASLVLRLLAREPAHRPEDAEALRRELAELCEHQGSEYRVPLHAPSAQVARAPESSKPAASVLAEAARPLRRRALRAGAWVGAMATAGLATVAAYQARGGEAPPPPPPMARPPPEEAGPPSSAEPVPAAPAEAPPAALPPPPSPDSPGMRGPPEKEGPTMTPPRSAHPACAQEKQVPAFKSPAQKRKWCESAAVVGTTLAFCAGCAGAQLRPEPGDCPPEVREEMQKYGIKPGDYTTFTYTPEWQNPVEVVLRSGKIVGSVPALKDEEDVLPSGTLLYGQVWVTPGIQEDDPVGEEKVAVRFTRAVLPGGQEFPVCIVAGDETDGGELRPRSRPEPGSARMSERALGLVVSKWPNPPRKK